VIGEPSALWFSTRSAAGTWSKPTAFRKTDDQVGNPAAAVGKDGTAIVTWTESTGILSSFYSFGSGAWSEPLTVDAETSVQNRAVTFSETGAAVAYFELFNVPSSDSEQKSVLANGIWGVRQTVPAAEAGGALYSVTPDANELEVTPLHPHAGQSAPPGLSRPRCEGY
jgi:hypothetical protein